MRNSILYSIFILLMPINSGYSQMLAEDEQQPSPPGSEVEVSEETPYEIVVTPLTTRAGLRTRIAQVEEDFYNKFNELNIDDNYDIACYKHTPTGSHISSRVCEPVFMLRERADMASFSTLLLGAGGDAAALGLSLYENDAQLVRNKKKAYETLQELMEEFTRSNAEFRSIGEVLADLKYRLDNYGKDD